MKVLIAICALLVVSARAQTGPCANIRTRQQWGARAANTAWIPSQPPTHVVIHHTDGQFVSCATQAACDQMMRNIQNFHMNSNGWADIGYNFCIGNTAVVYEARGWNRQGAHSPSFNSRSIGFCFIGAFHTVLPPAAALNTAQAFITCARDWGRLASNYRLLGHRQDIATTCPGNALFAQIQTWPRWS
jgi:peptidoglycan recognition protein